MTTLLHEDLARAASRTPDALALVCGNRRMSLGELDSESQNLAADLGFRGLARGDRVLILLPNCPAAVVSIYATARAGGVFALVNAGVQPPKLGQVLANAEPAFVITDAAGLRKLSALPEHLPRLGVYVTGDAPMDTVSFEMSCRLARPGLRSRLIDLDLAAIIYTSGTTSTPKGVTLSHRSMVSALRSIRGYLHLDATDVIFNALPLSFDYGLYQLFLSVGAGATLILRDGLGFPFEVLRAISSHGVTVLPCVPTMMAMLLRLEAQDRLDLGCVRMITSTGAALPGSFIPRLQAMFPASRIYSMYGLTECKRVSWLDPDQLGIRPGSVGRPMPNTEVFVVDEDGTWHDRDATGELVVRGSSLMNGYWRDPEATAEVLRPGPLPGERVLFTGDLFRLDADGYLYFLGRRDELFKSRGERVSPREIEAALYALDGVTAVRVTPVEDPVLGNAIRAEVEATGCDLTEEAIRLHCRAHLEAHLVPGEIIVVDELPRSAAGKVIGQGSTG